MDALFWLKYMFREVWPYTKTELKGEDVFKSSDNCGYFLVSGSFLKVNYKVESEIISRNFLNLVTLQPQFTLPVEWIFYPCTTV